MKNEFFECACSAMDHTLRFNFETSTNFGPEITIEAMLTVHPSFWKRVWIAVKYVFKRRPCKYGFYDDFILRGDNVPRLMGLLSEYERRVKENSTDQIQ